MEILMRAQLCLPVLAAIFLTACGKPESFAPPPQVQMPTGAEPSGSTGSGERLLVLMSHPDANAQILGGVFTGLGSGGFRFTGLHPRFLLRVDDPAGFDFYVRFFNHDEALQARGPLSFTVRVNGKSFRSPRFDKPGDQEYRRPLPDGWLDKPGPVAISVDIDPPWRGPDGEIYGVLLHSIGFERKRQSPGVERLLVAMSDPDANVFIVDDVLPAPDRAEFRFTGLNPHFLLRVNDTTGLDFYVRFFNHDEALRARGPVSFTVQINGKGFSSERFDTPGEHEFRWHLPDGWIEKPGVVGISLDIAPPWRQPDGTNYGVLLNSIGFERKPSLSFPDRRVPVVQPRIAWLRVASILFAASFTFLVSLVLGKSVLQALRVELYGSEGLFIGFVFGAACLSTLVFLLSVLHLAYSWVFLVTGCAIIAIAWRFRAIRFRLHKEGLLPRNWALLFAFVYGVFAILYIAVALCPEASPDGAAYHVALPALYLREHHIPAITTNLLATLPEGVEMLYLYAFSFGRHSAAAMVHLLFTLLTPLGMLAFGKRMGSPVAGAVGGLLFFLSPATGFVGTAAYVDVAVAAVVFAVFYLVQIWRQEQRDVLLIPLGLLAGFAYAIKYTAFLVVAYAAGAVALRLWRLRKPVLRPCAIVALSAFAMMLPWLVKNTVVIGNPVAPFANRVFPNPYFYVSTERAYSAEMSSLGGLHVWEWPYDITSRGSRTEGFIGPVFFLAPLAVLALRIPMGRQLLCAAAVFLVPYPAAVAARFLLPALPFVALALGVVVSRWKYVAAGVVVLHAILSWPQVIPAFALLAGAPGPRLEMPDWRASLRLTPESDFLRGRSWGGERLDGYGIGVILDARLPPSDRALSFRGFQQAYHSRQVLVEWESAAGVRLGESIRAAIDPRYQPTEQHRFSFPPRPVQRIRLSQSGRGRTADQWSVNELRIFCDGRELPRQPQWRVRAFPNAREAQLAFDNSLLTRWASRQPATPGMYIEIDFGEPQTINLVTAQSTPGQTGIQMELQFEVATGEWQSAASRHEVIESELPPRLRRAAMENLLRQNVQWLVVHDLDPGARDFLLQQPQWGIKLAGKSERYRLYHLDPISTPGPSASPVSSTSAPTRLEGFYYLENGRFRWTMRNFAATFAKLDQAGEQPARLTLSLYIPESSIQKLGPITLTARLGDHVLTPATYRQAGVYIFEREIDPQWLTSNPNRFEFSLDKSIPPTSADRRELGIIVMKALLRN